MKLRVHFLSLKVFPLDSLCFVSLNIFLVMFSVLLSKEKGNYSKLYKQPRVTCKSNTLYLLSNDYTFSNFIYLFISSSIISGCLISIHTYQILL